MKEIEYQMVVDEISRICQEANFDLGEDMVNAFKESAKTEKSGRIDR